MNDQEEASAEAFMNIVPQIEKGVIKFGEMGKDAYGKPIFEVKCAFHGCTFKNHRNVYKHFVKVHARHMDRAMISRVQAIPDYFQSDPVEEMEVAVRVRMADGIHGLIEPREEGKLHDMRTAFCESITQCHIPINCAKKVTWKAKVGARMHFRRVQSWFERTWLSGDLEWHIGSVDGLREWTLILDG